MNFRHNAKYIREALDNFGLWPCALSPARYGGVYEGGRWLAFPCQVDEVPEDALGDDVACAEWWNDTGRSNRRHAATRKRGVTMKHDIRFALLAIADAIRSHH